jgi:DNA-binding GntR family transcriptional regulator
MHERLEGPTLDAGPATPSPDRRHALVDIIATERSRNPTVQQLVTTSIRQAIMAGVLVPGQRLRQEEMAELFGTSRIPVREGLRELVQEGLIRSEPHRGFVVTSPNPDDVMDVYELRILLEAEALRLAIPLLTDEDLDDLQQRFGEMQATGLSPEAELTARERFYLRLYSVAGKPRLLDLIARLRRDASRTPRSASVLHSRDVHQRFFEAVRLGDVDQAVALLSGHYRRVGLLIRRYAREAAAAAGSAERPASRSG